MKNVVCNEEHNMLSMCLSLGRWQHITSMNSYEWPRCRTLRLTFLNFAGFTQDLFPRLSRSFWMASLPSSESTAPHSLVSSVNLLRVHAILLSMSLMKILSSICLSTDPWETPPVTGFHFDIELFTRTLCMQPSIQFLYSSNSQSVEPISLQFSSKILWGSVSKGLAEVYVDDIVALPLPSDADIASQKTTRFVRCHLPSVKPCCPSLITSLTSMSSRRMCSLILLGM